MQAHIVDATETRHRPVVAGAAPGVVTPVGTFASGQSAHGSFHVAAEAEVGTFASGVADDGHPEGA